MKEDELAAYIVCKDITLCIERFQAIRPQNSVTFLQTSKSTRAAVANQWLVVFM